MFAVKRCQIHRNRLVKIASHVPNRSKIRIDGSHPLSACSDRSALTIWTPKRFRTFDGTTMEHTVDFSSQHARIVILIDLDFFYGQVEQIRNPRLQGLPFCIKQKHVVVTASYAARKYGVKKLQLWTEARQLCPDLITIVGEDLTHYRIASKEIREFVATFVWGGRVEKLGLDELFLDVTDQVNAHLQHILSSSPQYDSMQTFEIDQPTHPSPRSFTYKFGSFTGFLEPATNPAKSSLISYSTLQLFVASHFAQHVRAELFASLGYTTSAGIASTKLVAKLLSDLHKPALQSVQNPHVIGEAYQSWLDAFKVEKLNGFGFRIGCILRNKILGEEIPTKRAYGDADKVNGPFYEESSDDVATDYSSALLNGRLETAGKLTVGKVRTSASLPEFISWFGNRLGPRLWELLHGVDSSEIVPTPTFPKQISVEDSYPNNQTISVLSQSITILSKSLVRRLDLDLRVGNTYVRFPKTLRLSMRNGQQIARESKSARMPVELFDLTIPREKRAELAARAAIGLAKAMIAGWPAGWKVGVINVAATDLMEDIPGQGIQGFIDRKKENLLDWDVVSALPEDIRTEVLKQYHLSPDKLERINIGIKDKMHVEESYSIIDRDEKEEDGEIWDDEDDEMDDTMKICDICGIRIFHWMTEAHTRYHKSLP